jgi:hypothetical protein
MIPLAAALRQVDADLGAAGRSWALIGGLAVAARATPAHLTSTVEGAVADPTGEAAAAIGNGFARLGYRSVPVTGRSNAAGAKILHLISPAPQRRTVFVDLLLAVSGIEPDVVAAADRITVLGGQIPVAKLGHLLALKLLANRPQDQMDGARLILAASDAELRRARQALDLIAERGFARDEARDLQVELTQWIERASEIA